MWKRHLFLIFLTMMLGFSAGSASANRSQPLENPWTLCAKHTQQQERAYRIPHRLLRAISLAESGRWRSGSPEISAWPWTVMAQGEGRFFETKKAAITWVRDLQSRGIKNIDVGCMQVNLNYHGHQFPSIEHAMEPDLNTAYAARFLREKFTATRSWALAAGHYHSTDPKRNLPYREKVLRFWKGKGSKTQIASVQTQGQKKRTGAHYVRAAKRFWRPPLDHERTKKLNSRFKQARMSARKQPLSFRASRKIKSAKRSLEAAPTADFRLRRRAQLDQWRRAKHWKNESLR